MLFPSVFSGLGASILVFWGPAQGIVPSCLLLGHFLGPVSSVFFFFFLGFAVSGRSLAVSPSVLAGSRMLGLS